MEWITKIAEAVRDEAPLVHCITNIVTVNDCANMLLAAGACPTMAHDPREVAEITTGCRSLVLNLGATESYEAMFLAAQTASEVKHPIVLDPVGCGGSSFRREMFWKLQEQATLTCIRGNASEIRALAENQSTVTGVDAAKEDAGKKDESWEDVLTRNRAIAQKLARQTRSIVVLSGATDIITDGKKSYLVKNGHEMMTKITGSGCMTTALLGAFLSVTEKKLQAAVAAMTILGICGEQAAGCCSMKNEGNMSFRQYFVDAMYRIEAREIKAASLVEEGEGFFMNVM